MGNASLGEHPMATAIQENITAIAADSDLINSIVAAVGSCLSMCGATAKCVGVSTVPNREPGRVTGLIGVHGDVSGFVTVNLAEKVACSTVGGMLQERFDELTPQVIDGVGEMTNIIAGGIKNKLSKSRWSFSHVTVPSVIIGNNYQIAYAPGLEFLSVVFEHRNDEALMLEDRLLQVAVSLIRL
jgi:chemotaxis protein CheX